MRDDDQLDRFDRMLLIAERVAAPPPAAPQLPAPRPWARTPVITSKRGSRFVDHAPCPMCGFPRVGIEYHGTLMSGAKVHTLAKHTAGSGASLSRQPRCLGAGMRIVFEGGQWKGAPS